ncbi:LLM class flavin-dependent oxidoreductase [Microbispora hainanensis]|jgi:alkanesulfonate monooxygenase SsuD/methylene tetrahydromethanopterin reductase-like flavin-dependent oxidoreductase (luciferase family)|uniref:LLM class flavin-dependent oxidoreductase n=1 Tax=Microbispora TaxID=2005 RepID=UPI0011C7B76A|nr:MULTISPECIES: LLM class flavin-dependent oxidoreductase [Microbispora]
MTLHLAVALDGAGWHPAAWRAEGARPDRLFTPGYWAELVAEAERGLLDFVTFEDALGLQSSRLNEPDGRLDQVRGRLDAVLIASRVAPLSSRIGLVPTTSTTHTEPFHVAIGIASLDHISRGRAGWRPQISGRPDYVAHFGRRPPFPPQDYSLDRDPAFAEHVRALFAEAADAVEVVRRLWDSWEDDAEIRDVATGRFIDRDKLHYIDFRGEFFSVKGPSITPRSPQGQPLVTSLAHDRLPYEFAARSSDVVYVTPRDREDAAAIVGSVRAAEAAVGRTEPPLRIFADLVVFLDAHDAAGRKARLDDLDGAAFESDAHVFTGTPEELAGLLLEWREAGLEGFRLRPGVLPHDLTAITRGLVPALQNAGAFRSAYDTADLRGRLGLDRPASRYAA